MENPSKSIILKQTRFRIILYSLPSIITFFIYLIGYYPGQMNIDSFEQWEQMITHNYNDWHPLFHTLFNQLITDILGRNPAAIASVQILMITLVFGYGLYCLEKIGVKKSLLWLFSAAFALYPAGGILSICLWKDIPYTASILLLTICTINIVFTNGEWLNSKLHILILILASLGTLFFRHNGILSFAAVFILLPILFRNHFKKIGYMFLIIAACYVIIKFPVYRAFHIEPTQSSEAMGIPLNITAGIIKNDGYITDYQREVLNSFYPIEQWKKQYNPYCINPIKFDSKYLNMPLLLSSKKKFFTIWLQLMEQNPKLALEAYGKQTSVLWQLTNPVDGPVYIMNNGIQDNKFGFKNIELVPQISKLCYSIYDFTRSSKVIWFFWRPALHIYISLIILVMLIIKYGFKSIIIIAPVMMNLAGLIVAIPAQDFRYLYCNVLATFLFIPLIIFVYSKRFKNASRK